MFTPKEEFVQSLQTIQSVTRTQALKVTQVKAEETNADILKTYQKNDQEVHAKGPVLVTTLKVDTVGHGSPTKDLAQQPIHSPLDTLVQHIEESATSQEQELHQKARHMIEIVGALGSLTSSFVRVFSMAAMACPHCISATAPLFSGGLFSGFSRRSSRGHWHKDGTFHADDEHLDSENANGFWLDWLKVA